MYLPWRGPHSTGMFVGSKSVLVISATGSCSRSAFSALMTGAYEHIGK
jgi:hypothetical protein